MKIFVMAFVMAIAITVAAFAEPTPIIVDGKCILFCDKS